MRGRPARESTAIAFAGLCAILAAAISPLAAQTRAASPGDGPLVLPRVSGPPVSEHRWSSIPSLPMVVRDPVFGAPPTERTEVRVAHDAHNLYVLARLHESDTAAIQAHSLYRDHRSGDDVVGILIDPFDDRENGLWFWTTPAGVRGDAEIQGDGQVQNDAWDGFWDAAVSRDAHGWTARIRIPFGTLGFQSAGDTVVMGITAIRYIARNNERHVFPSISHDWDVLQPSRARRVTLVGVSGRRPVYFTPYALVGYERDVPAGAVAAGRMERHLGLDVRHSPTPNLTLDVTMNTDFAQVEADDQRVNLTRFSLFFPERRRFFQERAGVFAFGTGGDGRLFHSRRIGLRDGRTVPILGGARLIGRLGGWDLGFLNMQTAGDTAGPAENFGVMRLRGRLFNPHSYAGMMATTRVTAEGAVNVAFGLDAVVRMIGDDYLTVRTAGTIDRSTSGARRGPSTDTGLVWLWWERRRQRGFRYILAAARTGTGYAPGVGFVQRTGVSSLVGAVSYPVFPTGHSPWRRVDPGQLAVEAVVRHGDGRVESAALEYNLDLEWRSGAELGADATLVYEDLPVPLELPADAVVPEGRYRFVRVGASLDSPEGDRARAEVDGSIGAFFDGWRADLEIAPVWNVSRHLELSAEYSLNAVRFSSRRQGFDAHIARVRAVAALNTHASATGFAQYSSLDRVISVNLRLRYNFAEGHDLWLVFDSSRQAVPVGADRLTWIVKYARTLVW